MLPYDWPPSTSPSKPDAARPTVGIVIPIRNGIKFFKLCLHSILYFTDWPFEVCVVDNLSNSKTRIYLESCKLNHKISVVRYDEEFNFAAQVNLGLRAVFERGATYGLIMNADTVASPFWLSQMVEVLQAPGNEDYGLVGPVTNIAIPQQEIPTQHQIIEADQLSGFCMLIRKTVFEALGGFDEQFKGGCYEDWDFTLRARKAGWRAAIDARTYIHHFHRAFRQGEEHEHQTKENQRRFMAKWPELLKPKTAVPVSTNGRVHQGD